ncbi:MAG: hypothetical protein KAJ63_11215, partial [Methyloprofundus sp.]|nr:hypothetical protein [Methyloprofundus sp.]
MSLLFLTSLNSIANNDDEDSVVPIASAAFSVHIDEDIINITGIQTQALQSTLFSPEIETFATRVDLSPLINTRKEYFTVLNRLANARITVKQSQLNVQRLESLHREKAVSKRKLLAQRSQLERDETNLKAAEQQANNIRLHTQEKWGKVLTQWFLNEEYSHSNMLNALSKPIYLIYLPAPLTSPIASVAIHSFGLREKAQSASLISSAAMHSLHPQATGTAFFYLSNQTTDTYHSRVTAWLPLKEDELSGFIIPASAIVWHLGQAYVYLQVDDELFKRVKIEQKRLVNTASYFIQDP